ncbi:E3 ubiquitin-protein ligase cblA-like [Temnothorax curvispinosus]|uniref:E3 ubiquitin-protein ligase cblA-like n=1 Tax=Temnothorax curvispinosus TaxID=300111 RepID=A0A6J1Q6L8_9HYME|nr:E3 ubiquitin-protein ligase cblA-like [Temnothorax curvispinosus]
MTDEEIITSENDNYEICTDFLSESCNSTSEEPLRIANSNINANISGDLLTLVQRQDSVKNEQLQDEQFTSENATDMDVTINNTRNFTSANPIITTEDTQNTNNISNLSQSNNEFGEERIYNIPEDDFGYWYEDQESTLESDCVPYHKVERHSLETCEENRETKRSDRTCTACIDAEANQVFIPCGHICCCEECANHIMRENDYVKKCPICKEEISTVYKVYMS